MHAIISLGIGRYNRPPPLSHPQHPFENFNSFQQLQNETSVLACLLVEGIQETTLATGAYRLSSLIQQNITINNRRTRRYTLPYPPFLSPLHFILPIFQLSQLDNNNNLPAVSIEAKTPQNPIRKRHIFYFLLLNKPLKPPFLLFSSSAAVVAYPSSLTSCLPTTSKNT